MPYLSSHIRMVAGIGLHSCSFLCQFSERTQRCFTQGRLLGRGLVHPLLLVYHTGVAPVFSASQMQCHTPRLMVYGTSLTLTQSDCLSPRLYTP